MSTHFRPSPEAAADVRAQIAELAASGKVFSRRNIARPRGLSDPQLGGLLDAARRKGLIVRVGMTLTSHRAGHRRSIALWRGTGGTS